MTTTGTKEWATTNINLFKGCTHNCRYCYAKAAAKRYKRISKDEDWEDMEPNPKLIKNHGLGQYTLLKHYTAKRDGRIMFPSTHDITPENVDVCIELILELLTAGNEVLVVSKPHYSVIQEICEQCVAYKDQLQFRFTITTFDQAIAQYWEPGAPDPYERLDALKIAFAAGYKTSVSCEPYLSDPVLIYTYCKNDITESFWIGVMNKACVNTLDYELIKLNYTTKSLASIITRLYGEEKVRYKDSIQNLMGVDLYGNNSQRRLV